MRLLLFVAATAVLGAAQGPSPTPYYYTLPVPSAYSTEVAAPPLELISPQSAPEPQPSASPSLTGTKSFSSRPYQGDKFPRDARLVLPEVQPIGLNPPATSESAQPETAPVPVSGFVQRSGQNFVVNGSVHFFPGSNDYFLILRSYLSDDDVKLFFKVMAGNGIELVRTWAFLNGDEDPLTLNGTLSIQPKIGVYNELSLQRLDLILAEAGKNGVRIIFPFVNYWSDLGGMQWYVDQVEGPGHDLEDFYLYPSVIRAFQEYVIMILTRVNTITGVAYSDDPTIFALELANEPHTSDNYETIRGISPGLLVKAWMKVIVETIRVVDKNHMISSGEEGWQVDGGVNSSWITNGTKGVDFKGNLELFDFATVHLYPGNWEVPYYVAADFATDFIHQRAKIAQAANKPFILEETGKALQYPYPRPQFLSAMFSAGERAGAAAMMPWELVAWHVNPNASGGFDFGIDDPSFGPITQMIQYMNNKTSDCAAGACPSNPQPCLCYDIPPTGSKLTCVQQVAGAWDALSFGVGLQVAVHNCTEAWLGPGTCDLSCGRCTPCKNHDYCNYCIDSPPDPSYTCTQQLALHPDLCTLPFIQKGTCDVTCHRCKPCPDPEGPKYCQANVQVGPMWNITDSVVGAKQNVILSAPGPATIHVPYNLTVTGPGILNAVYTWEWNTTDTTATASGVQTVTGQVTAPYSALLANGGNAISVGSIDMTGSRSALFPTAVEINGKPCGLVVSSYKGA